MTFFPVPFFRSCERAKALGWRESDELVKAAIRARVAMTKLATVVRYAAGAHAGDRADGR